MVMKSRTLGNISAILVVMIIISTVMFRPVLSQSPEGQPVEDQEQGGKETANEKHVEDHDHHERDNEQQDDQEQGGKETANEKHVEDPDHHESDNKQQDDQDQEQGCKETTNEKRVEEPDHHERDNKQQDDQEQGGKETANEKHVEEPDHQERDNKQQDDQEQGGKESEDEKYFKSLPGEFREYVNECAKQISRQCGEEIFASILNKSKVSTICCHDLVEMGLQCHNALVRFVAISPKYKHMAVQITGSSREVFNHCVQVDN